MMKIGWSINAPIMVCALLMIIFSFAVFASPTDTLKKSGQGKMSWLFIDIYQASLFSLDGKYQPEQFPQALTIHYQRDISKKALLKATQQQWQHLAVEPDLYQDWLQQLSVLWPEIKDGDHLTFLVSKDGSGDFYHNDNWIGRIENRALSNAFLSIWLSKKTSEPRLRKKLIGEIK